MSEDYRGCIALDEYGTRGLVMGCDFRVGYDTGKVWTGICLGPSNVGKEWSSHSPMILRRISEATQRMLVYMTKRANYLHRR